MRSQAEMNERKTTTHSSALAVYSQQYQQCLVQMRGPACVLCGVLRACNDGDKLVTNEEACSIIDLLSHHPVINPKAIPVL